ncbi:MAG: chaperone modulator CbpM [Lacunisphaera sp.]|nr:chaperone modulator CbpM [Lacunisphaera sp.]
MNDAACSSHLLVFVNSAESDRTPYSLAVAARLAAVHPDLLAHYCRIGLLGAARINPEPEPVFDDNTLYAVRRIEDFRSHHGVNLHALPLVCDLLREIEQLHTEVRFLRDR